MVSRSYDGPGGLIVRTAAHGAKKADFTREVSYLHRLNDVLEQAENRASRPLRWSSRSRTCRSGSSETCS